MQNTPHSWADHTLQCFPPILSEFFQQNSIPKEEKQQIKVNVIFKKVYITIRFFININIINLLLQTYHLINT
jgi:hypothetical protein